MYYCNNRCFFLGIIFVYYSQMRDSRLFFFITNKNCPRAFSYEINRYIVTREPTRIYSRISGSRLKSVKKKKWLEICRHFCQSLINYRLSESKTSYIRNVRLASSPRWRSNAMWTLWYHDDIVYRETFVNTLPALSCMSAPVTYLFNITQRDET